MTFTTSFPKLSSKREIAPVSTINPFTINHLQLTIYHLLPT